MAISSVLFSNSHFKSIDMTAGLSLATMAYLHHVNLVFKSKEEVP